MLLQPEIKERTLREYVMVAWEGLSMFGAKDYHNAIRQYVEAAIALRDGKKDAESRKRDVIERFTGKASIWDIDMTYEAVFSGDYERFNGMVFPKVRTRFPRGLIDEFGREWSFPIETMLFQFGDVCNHTPLNQVMNKEEDICYNISFGHSRGAPMIPLHPRSHEATGGFIQPNYSQLKESYDDGPIRTINYHIADNRIFSADIRVFSELP